VRRQLAAPKLSEGESASGDGALPKRCRRFALPPQSKRRGESYASVGFDAWHWLNRFPNVLGVTLFLRIVGLGTAAIWFGGTILYLLVISPLFGGTEIVRLLGPAHSGELGGIVAQRFYLFEVACAILALVLALAEWLYSGRPLERWTLVLLLGLLLIGSLGKLWLEPKCRLLNRQAYFVPPDRVLRQALTTAQREAEQSYAIWQGVAVALNLMSGAGIGGYFFQQAFAPNGSARLFPRVKLRI
jgi:Domain of unknown function (DUF4149)